MKGHTAKDRKLLTLLKHRNPRVRTIGWNIFFNTYKDALYRDARRSLLKRGMSDNLEEDTMTIVREMWLKVQDNIFTFEYRKEDGLYHYARSILAFQAWTHRHGKQREIHKLAREVSLDEADERGGETAVNVLLAIVDNYLLADDPFEVDPFETSEEQISDLKKLADDLCQSLKKDELALLQARFVSGQSYEALAAGLAIKPNNARQRVFRARKHAISTFVELVHRAFQEGRITFGTYRWLMSFTGDAVECEPVPVCQRVL